MEGRLVRLQTGLFLGMKNCFYLLGFLRVIRVGCRREFGFISSRRILEISLIFEIWIMIYYI